MFYKIWILSLVTSLTLFLSNEVKARDLFILWNDGTTTSYPIGDIENVTFSLLNLEFNNSDGSTINSDYKTIQRIYFDRSIKTEDVIQDGENVRIYPNPTSGELNFKNIPNGASNFSILDVAGNKVLEGILKGTSGTYNIGNLKKGVYFILIDQKLYKIIRL